LFGDPKKTNKRPWNLIDATIKEKGKKRAVCKYINIYIDLINLKYST